LDKKAFLNSLLCFYPTNKWNHYIMAITSELPVSTISKFFWFKAVNFFAIGQVVA
jgi:hypothetical protein